VVTTLWVINPLAGVGQLTLLVIAWLHGCLGIHYWLRTKPWHERWVPALRVAGLLTPTLAIVGYVEMGLAVQARSADSAWLAQAYAPLPPGADVVLDLWRYTTHGIYLGLIGLVFVARWLRAGVERRRKGALRLTYPNGRQVTIVPGTSVLEASQMSGIPHASLCGGRGRCSTCRTRIGAGLEDLPAPSAEESKVLRRVNAPANVRLACQLRPVSSLEVFPLLPAAGNIVDSLRSLSQSHGQEQEIAILFSDLHSFTKFSENRLPYDIVFVLNQYFAAVGAAIERSGGYLDKFIGDGTMALFGLAGDPALGCRQALAASARMAAALDEVNLLLNYELREPLRMGIGIHVGPVIIGEMGHGRARSLTAIGDPANTASRLEPLNKEYGSQVVVSAEVAERAGVDLSGFRREAIAVRGREAPMEIFVIEQAVELESMLESLPGRDPSAVR
jgi:adenylate cyclase